MVHKKYLIYIYYLRNPHKFNCDKMKNKINNLIKLNGNINCKTHCIYNTYYRQDDRPSHILILCYPL